MNVASRSPRKIEVALSRSVIRHRQAAYEIQSHCDLRCAETREFWTADRSAGQGEDQGNGSCWSAGGFRCILTFYLRGRHGTGISRWGQETTAQQAGENNELVLPRRLEHLHLLEINGMNGLSLSLIGKVTRRLKCNACAGNANGSYPGNERAQALPSYALETLYPCKRCGIAGEVDVNQN